jgi:anti-sigma B factor antagonist
MIRAERTDSPPRPAPTPGLQVEESYGDDGTRQLRLRGELDLASGEPLRERLRQLRHAKTPTRLDLSGLTFIDCSGLRVILTALDAARDDGARLDVSSEHSAPVRRLLELTRKVSGSIPALDRAPAPPLNPRRPMRSRRRRIARPAESRRLTCQPRDLR